MIRSDKIGWNTDAVSREQLVSSLDEAIRSSSIFVHDPTTIQELAWFVINKNGRAEAQAKCYDDTGLALALMVIVMARMPRPRPAEGVIPPPKVALYGRPALQDGERDSRGVIVRRR